MEYSGVAGPTGVKLPGQLRGCRGGPTGDSGATLPKQKCFFRDLKIIAYTLVFALRMDRVFLFWGFTNMVQLMSCGQVGLKLPSWPLKKCLGPNPLWVRILTHQVDFFYTNHATAKVPKFSLYPLLYKLHQGNNITRPLSEDPSSIYEEVEEKDKFFGYIQFERRKSGEEAFEIVESLLWRPKDWNYEFGEDALKLQS